MTYFSHNWMLIDDTLSKEEEVKSSDRKSRTIGECKRSKSWRWVLFGEGCTQIALDSITCPCFTKTKGLPLTSILRGSMGRSATTFSGPSSSPGAILMGHTTHSHTPVLIFSLFFFYSGSHHLSIGTNGNSVLILFVGLSWNYKRQF